MSTNFSIDQSAIAMQAIEMTPSENNLLKQIKLDASALTDTDDARRNGEVVRTLILSLIEREAIPERRWRYLLDPECNIGGRGSSRKDIFERNGTSGDDLFRHPHFLNYLRYLLYGAQLPVGVIEGFCQKVSDCGMVTSGDIGPLSEYAKRQARVRNLAPPDAAEEFYKLSLDCGLDHDCARAIRNAVKRLR